MPRVREPDPPEEVADVAATWLKELDQRGRNAVDVLWQRYQAGQFPLADSIHQESKLQVIAQTDLLAIATRDEETKRVEDLQVQNFAASNLIGNNFMGFTPRNRCFAFRGEKMHLKTFLDFAYSAIDDKHVMAIWKPASEVKFPEGGLARDLDYQDFASRVEIVEYAIWLTQAESTDGPPIEESTVTILSVVKDGSEISVPPPNNTQYEADISFESEDDEAETETVPDEQFSNEPEMVPSIPHIAVEPPSPDVLGTEYRRPQSWSPLTDDNEEEVIADVTKAPIESTITEPPKDNRVDENIIKPAVTSNENQDGNGEAAGQAPEAADEVMTDGSLFGGSIGELEFEADGPTHHCEAMDLDMSDPENFAPANYVQGDETTIGEKSQPTNNANRRDSGHVSIVLPSETSVKDQGVVSSQAADSNADLCQEAQTQANCDVPESREDQVGVNDPIHHPPEGAHQMTVRIVQLALESAKSNAQTRENDLQGASNTASYVAHYENAPGDGGQVAKEATSAPESTQDERSVAAIKNDPDDIQSVPVTVSQDEKQQSRQSATTTSQSLPSDEARVVNVHHRGTNPEHKSEAQREQRTFIDSPLAPSEDGTDPLALSDGENPMSGNRRLSYPQSYLADAALASRLAAEESRSRYGMRKRSSTQERDTPSPQKTPRLGSSRRKTLPAIAATPKISHCKGQTPQKSSAKKKAKVFREGTRRNPKRVSGSANHGQ